MHRHHDYLHYFHNRELNEIYATMAIRSFALSMITVFVPIFLLLQDYSMRAVLIFYAVQSFAHVLCVIPAAKISARFGFKHAMLFSTPLLIIFYLMLHSIKIFHWPLSLMAAILGMSTALFWLGYHVDFSKFSDKNMRGEQVGLARTIIMGFETLGPLAGGLLLTAAGFKIVFIAVCLLLLLSVIPLLLSKDIHEPIPTTFRETFKGQSVKNMLGFAGIGIENGMGSVIWPVFIFFTIFNSYAGLGSVVTVSIMVSLVFIFMVSRLSNSHGRLILRTGSAINAFIWGIKTIVWSSLQVFVVDSWHGMANTMIVVPFEKLCYDKASQTDAVKFIAFKEIVLNLAKGCLFLLLLAFADFGKAFFIGSCSSLLFMFF